ncbi:uncharacterized protein LOC119192020, partial [Manduca sexta]|uniref:uncharacterized protein LOC119192020 n=1 Tax=Manduca sexta TaxID=7130 RepID=UPI00188E6AFF
VILYENNVEKPEYNVLEEVKDLWFSEPYLFTARDLDVTVTEIKPEESKTKFITRHTMEGRAPLRISGSRLLILARGGNNLRMHDASIETTFKVLHEVKVSDMIVTSLTTSNNDVWTGGWDGCIRRWKISGDKLEPAGEISVQACINAIVANENSVYAAVSGGKIVHVKGS